MRVTDSDGGEWLIVRRFAPWLRRIRPLAIVTESERYREVSFTRSRGRSGERLGFEDWLMLGFAVGQAAGLALILSPVVIGELLAWAAAGAFLRLARLTGLVRARVDLIAPPPAVRSLAPVRVLLVPGSAADRLIRELATLIETTPDFDPENEPRVRKLFSVTGARVERHFGLPWRLSGRRARAA
ncbi:hypothetical protein [Amycolatopsis regifaucium]|uniref:Uncharacterized protein n=1 Tax=Amycolatopsis regifaucium TaxID=546365 RepID=A0A154M4K0_9PSEU|nr:hypothetical protein [Amycolatopsis regifaucium]KZB79433.1 hypothetical protein AVL48_17790 [Amycolatopsis regifaucium]OKA07614.1 hypothetical protein ATP06_0217475 [Amycolatopsis regifaucium]SFH07067.1 hypothetical protein SAMN04489731_102318 [Amycolatopsis regifaucium]